MKKVVFLLLVFAGFIACENEIIEELPEETSVTEGLNARQNQKVDVCHKGEIINVSVNALSGHQGHGDAVDMDGDGYFDLENDCAEGVDCDDTDATVNPDIEEVCDNDIDDNCNGEIDEGCVPSIGDFYQGGIVFYLDESGQHGLVAAVNNLSEVTNYPDAVNISNELELNEYSDWYLPKMDELHLMMLHLKKIGGLIENFDPGVYTASKPNGNISNDAVGGLIEYFSLGGMQIYNSSVPDDVFIFNSSPDQIIIINSNLNLNDSYDVGGLIGDSLEFNSTIENSYPTGDVHGDGYNIGGLIGLYSSYSISNSTANVYYVNDLGEGALGGLLVRPVRAFSVD